MSTMVMKLFVNGLALGDNMKDLFKAVFFVLLAIAIIGGIGALKYSVWSECRDAHSWLYCMYVLGGR